jgi:ribosomal-protein-serine acetyltransferase
VGHWGYEIIRLVHQFVDLEFSSGEIVLRRFKTADLAELVEYGNDPLTQLWLPIPNPYTEEHAKWFIDEYAQELFISGRGLLRAIDLNGRLGGSIDIKKADWAARTCEISYWSAPWARSRGVMTSALKILTDWVLNDQGMERVEVRVATKNIASQRVAEKAGFTREGIARNAGFIHAGRVDLVIFSMVAGDLSAYSN